MPAIDALHLKRILYEDLDGRMLRKYLTTYLESQYGLDTGNVSLARDLARVQPAAVSVPAHAGRGLPGAGPGRPIENMQAQEIFTQGTDGDQLAGYLQRILDVSENFYVAPDMLELAVAAAETMPDEPLLMEDVPTMAGFMYLPSPIRLMDIRGRLLSVNAVIWQVVGGKVVFHQLTDKNDPSDMISVQLREQYGDEWVQQLPRFSLADSCLARFGQELPRTIYNATPIPPGADVHIGHEDGNLILATNVPMDLTPEVRRDPFTSTMLALWRLMQQPLTNVSVEYPDRHTRKQLARVRLRDQRVTVIELRRRESRDHGPAERDYDHRWLVRGHWRRQPCKDAAGEWTHRVIWISPYIKGPEGTPLIIRDRINALLR